MATRLERVVLELDDKFSREMLKPAASVRLFREELKGLDKDSGAFSRTTSVFERDSARIGTSIDRFSGRLALIAQSAGALGPALVPITTALVPAIAGLTTGLGFAVAAAGTSILAFQGVGDTLDALNKAQLEPTAANLEKLREAANKLSPAARDLVLQLDDMGPAFRQVRDAASEGLLPGVSDALDEIETLLPRMASLAGEIGTVTGELLGSGAESLAGPEWEDFFSFIEAEARPTLTRLGKTVGHVTKGLAEMWMAFDPLSDDFIGGLLDASEAFESWSEGLSDSEDFREFVEYVRETGPIVLETLGDIGNMFLQIAEAAAPLGGPTLEILGAVADIIATVADSDLGTPIMTGVAAFSALNLVMRVTKTEGGKAFTGLIKGQAEAVIGLRGLRGELALLRADYLRTGDPAKLTALAAGAEKSRAGLTALGKGAGLAVGGIALMETGLVETKTATFLLTGALLGGAPGAVAGGLIGAVTDLVSVGREADATARAWGRSFVDAGGDITVMADTVESAHTRIRASLDDLHSETGGEFLKNIFDPDVLDVGLHEIIGGKSGAEKEFDAATELEEKLGDLRLAARQFTESQDLSDGALAASLLRIKPALDGLGISYEELGDAVRDGSIMGLVPEIEAWMVHAESAEVKTDNFALALADLGDEADTTADRAGALSDAMDALFNPKLDLAAARNDWKQALQQLGDNLDTKTVTGKDGKTKEVAGSRSLFDNSEGALKNQDEMIARTRQILTNVNAIAEVDPEKAVRVFKAQKEALVDTAVQAGLNRDEVEKYLKVLGFTEKTWTAVIEAAGVEAAERKADRLAAKLDRLARRYVATVTVKTINSGDRFGVSLQDRDGNGIPDYKEFYSGGYTGDVDKRQVAGVVHGREFVVNADATAINRPLLEAMNRSVPGYRNGGFVDPSRAVAMSPSLDMRGLAADIAPLLAGLRPVMGDMHVTAHNINDIKRELDAAKAMSSRDGVRAR